MVDDDKIIEAVTAKLCGKFYVGQRVFWPNHGTRFLDGTGVIEAIDQERGAAHVLFDNAPYPLRNFIFLWALRAI